LRIANVRPIVRGHPASAEGADGKGRSAAEVPGSTSVAAVFLARVGKRFLVSMSEASPPGIPTSAQTANPDLVDQTGRALASSPERVRGLYAVLIDKIRRLRAPIVAIATVGAVLSGFVGYWNTYRTVRDSAVSTKQSTSPHPLSVAIVPFVATTGNTDEQRVGDELARDVAIIFGRDRWYKVIPPSLVSSYKGNTSDARGIGREFDVRYVAQGELRRGTNKKNTLNVQLVDASSGAIAWSDRLEFTLPPGPNETLPELRIARRLHNAIYDIEIDYSSRHPSSANV